MNQLSNFFDGHEYGLYNLVLGKGQVQIAKKLLKEFEEVI